jgi:hypothetical protein
MQGLGAFYWVVCSAVLQNCMLIGNVSTAALLTLSALCSPYICGWCCRCCRSRHSSCVWSHQAWLQAGWGRDTAQHSIAMLCRDYRSRRYCQELIMQDELMFVAFCWFSLASVCAVVAAGRFWVLCVSTTSCHGQSSHFPLYTQWQACHLLVLGSKCAKCGGHAICIHVDCALLLFSVPQCVSCSARAAIVMLHVQLFARWAHLHVGL